MSFTLCRNFRHRLKSTTHRALRVPHSAGKSYRSQRCRRLLNGTAKDAGGVPPKKSQTLWSVSLPSVSLHSRVQRGETYELEHPFDREAPEHSLGYWGTLRQAAAVALNLLSADFS